MPTVHDGVVSLKRATLLLAIHQGIAVDVVSLIFEQLEKRIHSRGVRNWFYPKLITAFAISQGVHIYDWDKNCNLVQPINQWVYEPVLNRGAGPSMQTFQENELIREHQARNEADNQARNKSRQTEESNQG